MGRLPRIDVADGWHHVMNRGAAGRAIFGDEHDRLEFERLLAAARRLNGVEVHAYCLMGNHFHLLLRCPSGGVSRFMQYVTSMYTRHLNRRCRTDGPVFRGRFRSVTVDDDDQVLSVVRYIHRNPTDLGPRVQIATYRWSSHAVYLGDRARPAWLTTSTVIDRFSRGLPGYAEFVASDRSVRGDELRQLIRLVIGHAEIGARPGITKTVEALVLDDRSSSSAAAVARRRARLQLANDPQLRELVDRVRRLAA